MTQPLELLRELVDPDPCYFDHHGYCQAHGWMTVEPACPHARTKELLADSISVESREYEVVGDWGVDGADNEAHARRKVSEALAAYPHCGARAQTRLAYVWDDGSEYYGPWEELNGEGAQP
ncbi:hypothetical protein [Streptomyces sp900116325]|uniref:hypothetical protein n=1 Tax=Streptomyces sp. 900116325 TaxID=3154295 RepID=UPI0033CE8BCE